MKRLEIRTIDGTKIIRNLSDRELSLFMHRYQIGGWTWVDGTYINLDNISYFEVRGNEKR